MNANYVLNEQLEKLNAYVEKIKNEKGNKDYGSSYKSLTMKQTGSYEDILKENNEKLRVKSINY